MLFKLDLDGCFGDLLPPLARCIIQSNELLGERGRSSVANSTRLNLYPEILPPGTLLARQLSVEPTFLVPYWQQQPAGHQWLHDGRLVSLSPNVQHIWICITIRADAFVSTRISTVLLPSFLSTRTNRDCITRSLQTLFPQCSPDDFGFRRRYRCCCIFLPCTPLLGNGLKDSSVSRPFMCEKCIVQQL